MWFVWFVDDRLHPFCVTSGKPRMRLEMMLYWISWDPPAMVPDLPRSQARVAPSSTFGAAKPTSRPRASIFGWLPLPRFLQKHA